VRNYLGSPALPEKRSGSELSDRAFAFSVALAFLVGLALRWRGLNSQSLWWDEGFTLWISQFSLKDLYHGLQWDPTPPLFYLLEHWWIHWFGNSEKALRGLSAFFESLSFPFFYLLAKDFLVRRNATAIAVWLFALCPFQIEYAQEARFYGLLSFIGLGTLYCTIRSLRESSWLWLCWAVLFVSAGLYTHYMMFFYLPGIAALWFIYPSGRSGPKKLVDFALASASVLIVYAPWLPTLMRQARDVQHSFWAPTPGGRTLIKTFFRLSGFETGYLSEVAQRMLHADSRYTGLLVQFLLLLVFAVCLVGGLARSSSSSRRGLGALLVYAVLPILLVFFASRVATPVYVDRVFIGTSAVMPIFYCAPVAFQSGGRRNFYLLVLGAVLVIVTISLIGYLRYSVKENWRGLAEYSSGIKDGPRLMLFVPYQAEILYDYYANRIGPSNLAIEKTGLPVRFDFQNPVRPYTSSFPTSETFEEFLHDTFQSDRYREVDVVMSHTPMEFSEPITDILKKQCSGFVEKDFRGIQYLQCTIPIVRSALRLK
jgi:hypothetical protein